MLTARRRHSRQSLKKYVKANNNITVTDAMFDSLFNKALRNGVEKGVFEQPKGTSSPSRTRGLPCVAGLLCAAALSRFALADRAVSCAGASGGTKLAKKAAKPAVKKEATDKVKKPAPKKEPKEKKAAAPKEKKAPAPKKEPKEKKAPAVKKDPKVPTKKATVGWPLPVPLDSAKTQPTLTRLLQAAPAIVEKPKALGKTKSGRVTKTTAAAPAAKKATPKKAAPKKEKAPKKSEAAAAEA